nr:uncharacterized protein LOC113710356 [Coffea arabica]
MPKGSKKRKAEKKKKEQEALSHNQSHNHQTQPQSAVSHTHENDDKESEGEEVSSPASQDHSNHQHQFIDGEKEDVKKVEDSSHVQLSGEKSKSIEEHKDNGVAVEEPKAEESVVQIEKEPKPAGELNGNSISEERVKIQKESGNGVASESLDGESTLEVEKELKLFEKVNASVEHVEPQKEHNDGVLTERRNDECRFIDKTNVVVDSSPFGSSAEAVNSFCEGLAEVPNPIPVGEVYGSVAEPDSDTVPEEKISRDSSSPGHSLLTSNVVTEMHENGKKDVAVMDQNDRSLPVLVDLGLENKRDEAIILAGNALRALEARGTVTQETEEKQMHLYTAPEDEAANYGHASNGEHHIKDSEVHGHSDTQPLVASAIRPVQRTSWMSCCGLFEAFAGSSR